MPEQRRQPYLYLASSWRNPHYEKVRAMLQEIGYKVYDFKNPDHAFNWADIDPQWENWDYEGFISNLDHPLALDGFKHDMDAVQECDVLVMLAPCGNSAHLEAGIAAGMRKPTYALLKSPWKKDLMYHCFTDIFGEYDEFLRVLSAKFDELSEQYGYVQKVEMAQKQDVFTPPHYGFETKAVTSDMRRFEHRSGEYVILLMLDTGIYKLFRRDPDDLTADVEELYSGTSMKYQESAVEILKQHGILT